MHTSPHTFVSTLSSHVRTLPVGFATTADIVLIHEGMPRICGIWGPDCGFRFNPFHRDWYGGVSIFKLRLADVPGQDDRCTMWLGRHIPEHQTRRRFKRHPLLSFIASIWGPPQTHWVMLLYYRDEPGEYFLIGRDDDQLRARLETVWAERTITTLMEEEEVHE